MAGRGAQTFKKRQKEQQRKERQQEKFAKRMERKRQGDVVDDTAVIEPAVAVEEGADGIVASVFDEHGIVASVFDEQK